MSAWLAYASVRQMRHSVFCKFMRVSFSTLSHLDDAFGEEFSRRNNLIV
jgi:hypothetical protein